MDAGVSGDLSKQIDLLVVEAKRAFELELISKKYLEALESLDRTSVEARTKYDVVLEGYVGYNTTRIVQALREIREKGKTPNLIVNSGGGNPFHGYQIANAVEETKASVEVNTLAGSAASLPVFAAKEVTMKRGSQLMIHRPVMLTGGNVDQIKARLKSLETMESNIITLYSGENSLLSEADARTAVFAETWYSAAEAKTVPP